MLIEPRRALLQLWRSGVVGLALMSATGHGLFAQTWRFEPSLSTTMTATNNSGILDASVARKDLVFDLAPRLVLQGRGASFSLDGNIAGHGLVYANNSQPNRFLPEGIVSLNANLLDRWLYIDTFIGADQTSADPYTARADSDNGLNRINVLQYRISPYLKHSFTPSLSLLVRGDNTWVRRRGIYTDIDPRRNSSIQKETFLLEQKPLPLGFSAELTQEQTSYTGGEAKTILKIGSGRFVGTYAADPTFVLGLVAGTERSEFALSSTTDNIAGVRLTWNPTERTEWKAAYERRFFGTGGSLQWSHRSPFIGIVLSASREPATSGTSFVLNPAGGDLSTLLDAIFTTRFPNPADRAIIVKNVISGLGTPNALGEPVEVFSDYAQLRNSVNASIVFQGVRSTLTTRVYATKARQLELAIPTIVPVVGLTADNLQKGISVDFNRRLTPTLALDISAGYSEIEGLGLATGRSSVNRLVRLSVTESLTPKTKLTVGARYQLTDLVEPTSKASADEAAGFVGIVHRF